MKPQCINQRNEGYYKGLEPEVLAATERERKAFSFRKAKPVMLLGHIMNPFQCRERKRLSQTATNINKPTAEKTKARCGPEDKVKSITPMQV